MTARTFTFHTADGVPLAFAWYGESGEAFLLAGDRSCQIATGRAVGRDASPINAALLLRKSKRDRITISARPYLT